MPDGWIADALIRVAPILVFLAGITIVAELADRAGVFTSASGVAARAGGGSVRRLWLVVVALAALTTILLSLDTTAVLLTPVVLVLARRLGVPPWPFALATVWLANTASLVLPVSNLTNLLLVDQLHWSVAEYTSRMWLAALVAIVVSAGVLAILFRGSLSGRYHRLPSARARDIVLFRASVGVCAMVGTLVILGVAPWIVSVAGAAVLAPLFVWRQRDLLSWDLLPWRLVAITLALFLAVGFLQQHGLTTWLGSLAGSGDDLLALLRLSASGAVGSNLVNNLPAYIALEPVAASSSDRMLALLVGTNLGPLITVWGSLATLLWRERCRAADVQVSLQRFALAGIIGMPLLIVICTATLWAT